MKLIYDHPSSIDRSKTNGLKAYNLHWDFGFVFISTASEDSIFSLDKSEIPKADLEFVHAEWNWGSEPVLFSVSVGELSENLKLK